MSGLKSLYVSTTIRAHEALANDGYAERRYDFLCESMQDMARQEGRAIVYPSLRIRAGESSIMAGVFLEMVAVTVPTEAA